MTPNKTYIPAALQERAAWFQIFADGFTQVGTTLGFLPADVTQVLNDNEDYQFCASSALTIAAYSKAARQYRLTVTEGNVGDPAPQFPTNPSLNPPNQVPTGIWERLDELVKRIRVAPAYTPEIGALLGIIPASPARPPVSELKPTVTVSEAVDPYSFTMKATRFGLSAYKVQIQRNGSGNWVDNGFAQNNPHTVTISPTTAGQPERVLVRAVLMQNSEPVGIPSDPTYVTVNP